MILNSVQVEVSALASLLTCVASQQFMFLVNHLNRNITDQYYPSFECIYCIEIILICCQLLITAPIVRAVWRSAMHLKLRLRFILCILHAAVSCVVRLYVMYYQVFGPVERVETTPLIVCSLIRQAFLAYFTSLIFFIGIDRYCASTHWAWYERGGPSTLLFFIALELTHLSTSYADSFSLIYGYTSDIAYVVHCGIFTVIGSVCYRLVNNWDRREKSILKSKGASIDSYSVARSYQLKENLNLMEMFSRILIPFLLCVSPEFIFYPAFTLISKGIGYDSMRYFSIALYDVWIAVIAIVTIALVPLCASRISKHMPGFLRYSLFPEDKQQEERSTMENTDTYFTLLRLNWNDVRHIGNNA